MVIAATLGEQKIVVLTPVHALSLLLAIPLVLCPNLHGQVDHAQSEPSEASPGLAGAAQASPSRAGRRAEVSFRANLLTVVANNSSLNQVLREIARQTGMKVVGSVGEDRVFGTYGPASPATVLATLLDGTGSNLLIVQNAANVPTQVILTRRVGGVTPPDPKAAGFNEAEDDEDAPAQAIPPQPRVPPSQINSRAPNRAGTGGVDTNPAATSPSSTSQQLVFPPIDASTPPSTATTTPTAPDPTADSVRTPQQIFEQLQRLRQQQTQQAAPQ